MKLATVASVILAMIALTWIVAAQGPDDEKGRYALSPVDGGVLRLDKATGDVSLCAQKTAAWVCEPVEDRAKPGENRSRLEAENGELKARIKALEDQLAASELPAPKSQLPTEEDVDKALDYVESIFKKFRERIRKYEREPPASGSSESGKQL